MPREAYNLTPLAAAVMEYCYTHGPIVVPAGMHGNVIWVLFPFAIVDDDLAEGLTILQTAPSEIVH